MRFATLTTHLTVVKFVHFATLTVANSTVDANKCITNQACKGTDPDDYTKKLFNSTKSSTFKNLGTPFSIQDTSGSCLAGSLAVDVLAFAGLSYANQTFGLASNVDYVFGSNPFDGIMGLGWPALAVDNVVPPIQNLLPSLDKPLFTFWMDRKEKWTKNFLAPISMGGSGGLITYGALDTKNCDPTFNYVTLSSKTYWQFAIDSFSIGTYSISKSIQVISDTGTSFIGGPEVFNAAISRATNASYDEGSYIVPCNQTGLPDIVFTIGGMKYNIPSTEYVLDNGSGQYLPTIFDFAYGGFGPQMILGQTFIRTYCNAYDVGGGRIGFSKAHHTSV